MRLSYDVTRPIKIFDSRHNARIFFPDNRGRTLRRCPRTITSNRVRGTLFERGFIPVAGKFKEIVEKCIVGSVFFRENFPSIEGRRASGKYFPSRLCPSQLRQSDWKMIKVRWFGSSDKYFAREIELYECWLIFIERRRLRYRGIFRSTRLA